MRERLALPDDSGEAWLANFFDTNEIDWARAQAKPLRERIALLDRSLIEADDTVIEPEYCIKVNDIKIQYIHPEKPMNILGSLVTGAGKSAADIDNRVAKSWAAFWAQKQIFLNKHVDAATRIRALNILILPVLLYSAGSWTPTKADLSKLALLHMKLCKRILMSKLQPEESWVDYQMRMSHRVRAIWRMLSIKQWDHVCLERIHCWAGHLARFDTYDPLRLPAVLSKYRDSQFLATKKAQSCDGRHLFRGHCRPAWRWEQHLYLFYNGACKQFGTPTWRIHASNRQAWEMSRPKWVSWRLDRSLRSQGTW